MKRLYIIIVSIIVVLFISSILYFNNNKINVKEAEFNEEVTLKKGETIKIKEKEIYLTIKSFTNSPPPSGTQGIWSGLSVNYELKIENTIYTNSYDTPYDVIITKTDYETYANVIIKNK